MKSIKQQKLTCIEEDKHFKIAKKQLGGYVCFGCGSKD